MSLKPLIGTIDDLRKDGVSRLPVWCHNPACHHSADIETVRFDGTLTLEGLRCQLRCSDCGGTQVGLQADWGQYIAHLRAARPWHAPADQPVVQLVPFKGASSRPMAHQPPEQLPDFPGNIALSQQITFLIEVGELREVLRQTRVGDAARQENDAEHSWHVALMALVLAQYANQKIDVQRVVRMLLLHDIVEIDAGDTFVYDEVGKQTQQAREQAAADRIFALLPMKQASDFRATWDEFEEGETAESRYARAIDRLQPLLLNYTKQGYSWNLFDVPASRVTEINSVIDAGANELWTYARTVIDEAVNRGFLRDDKSPAS